MDFAVNNQEGLLEVYCDECERHMQSIPINRTKPYEEQVPDKSICFECDPEQ
ncbi:hypothetical protein VPHD148_0211 [Vibrio phage D148]